MSEFRGNIVVAVDDGYAQTKVVCLSPVARVQISIPSSARSGDQGAASALAGKSGVHPCYITEGIQYTVGDNLHNAESARFDGYPYSGMNRAIVHHALRVAAIQSPMLMRCGLVVATGLPLFSYYVDGKADKASIDRKAASLLQPVVSADGSSVANIVAHKVFPEGLAAWVDYAIDDNMQSRPEVVDMTVGVIDIGGRTTDIAVMLPGQCIDHARTTSVEVGVQDVSAILESKLNDRFSRQYGQRVSLSAKQLSESLTGSVRIFGKQEDVSRELSAAAGETMERLKREINKHLIGASSMDKILLVGGGAEIFSGIGSLFPNIEIPTDPAFANARGFAKYATLSSR